MENLKAKKKKSFSLKDLFQVNAQIKGFEITKEAKGLNYSVKFKNKKKNRQFENNIRLKVTKIQRKVEAFVNV